MFVFVVTTAATGLMSNPIGVLTPMVISGTTGVLIQMLIHTQVPQEQSVRQAIQMAIRGEHQAIGMTIRGNHQAMGTTILGNLQATLIQAMIILGIPFGAGNLDEFAE